MQFRSRDLLHSPKLFKRKWQQKSEVLRLNCYTTTYNIKNYKFVLLNGFLTSTQSPITSNSFNQTFPSQYLNIANQRNDLPKGLKMMQLVKKKKKKINGTRKSVPIHYDRTESKWQMMKN